MITPAPFQGGAISATTINGLLTAAQGLAETGNVGFYGKAPVAQPAAPAQPAATASTNVSPFGYATQGQADAINTAVRALIAVLSAALGGNGLTA